MCAENGGLRMSAAKRIIFVLGSLELGGAERQALLLARHLINEMGAHVKMWGFQTPGRMAELCEQSGIPWRIVPIELPRQPIQILVNLLKYARNLRNERPDILLPYTVLPNVVCGLVWRLTGARTCIWNQRDVRVKHSSNKLERLAVFNTPHFVSNSYHGSDYLLNKLKVNRKRVRVIRNGIELAGPEADRSEWRARLGVSETCTLACMVANISTEKDHVTMLKTWRIVIDRLAKDKETVVLLLAGRFDQNYEVLKEMAVRLNLGDSVRFLGQVNDVAGLLGAVDLGVFSSRLEGMPNGVLECMAAGLPMAATDILGIREAVGSEGYPYLAPLGDAEALADRILRLVQSRKLRAQVGAANRHRIAQEFSPQRMCKQMVELISQNV